MTLRQVITSILDEQAVVSSFGGTSMMVTLVALTGRSYDSLRGSSSGDKKKMKR